MWYTQQCLENGWSSTVLAHQIESGLYYRQALADKTTNFKAQSANPFSEQAEEIIKDPYIFDFIPNAKKLREIELEDALVQQITKLLLEFGSGFAFMGRQSPIQVGKREFFIDLLFYNVKYCVLSALMVVYGQEQPCCRVADLYSYIEWGWC